MKKILLFMFLILLISPIISKQIVCINNLDKENILDDYCDGDEIDFNTLLRPDFDPDNPDVFKPRQKRPVDYIPPVLRTIGFAILRQYVSLHNGVKKKILAAWGYLFKDQNDPQFEK